MTEKTNAAKADLNIHLFIVNILEKFIDAIRGVLSMNILDLCIKWSSKIGHFGIMAAALFGFLYAFVLAILTNTFTPFLYGIGWIVFIFVVQYTAHKFADAGETLIKNNPTQLGSKSFLDCFAFLALIGGVILFVLAIIFGIQQKSFIAFAIFFADAILLEILAIIAFNPKAITINIVKNNTAGQEAIGIVTFAMKAVMKMVPILFGVGVVVGTIMIIVSTFKLFGDSYLAQVNFAMERGLGYAIATALFPFYLVFLSALLPFLSYIFFVVYYLIIDVIKAILAVPEKLDKVIKK